jgi:riboflavin kinase / FMN adenylyltransferase
MEFVGDASSLPGSLPGSALTFGFFDGVHPGHHAIIERTRTLGLELGVPSVVAVFDRHPASIVRPESAPRLLTDLTQKLELLRTSGVDLACLVHFDEERSLQPPDEFVREVLVGQLRACAVIVGQDHHFGHRRRGDVQLLTQLGEEHGFRVELVPYVEEEGVGTISSTAIRKVLKDGDVRQAARLLGRPHEIHGVVEHGDGRGRTIGFPTANVAVPGDMLLPEDGVYAGRYRRPTGARHAAAISIGRRPTFYAENGLLLVEAHLLDFDDDLYGEQAWVEVDDWIRGQVRFESVDALVEQIGLDVEQTRSLTRRAKAPAAPPPRPRS